jgi:hypothetical protein
MNRMTVETRLRMSKRHSERWVEVQIAIVVSLSLFSLVRRACFQRPNCHCQPKSPDCGREDDFER